MVNSEVVRAFERIADLLEISGQDRFRVNSYRRVARALGDLTEDLAELAESKRLGDLPGVGKSTVGKIEEYLVSGTIALLGELESKLPAELPELLRIPGMGPKTVALVYREIGVESLADLQAAIDDGRLAELPGLGKKSAERIAEGIAFLKSSGGRVRLGEALPLAEELVEWVGRIDGVERVTLAGSIRRGEETVGDVDIVCESDRGKAIVERFVGFPGVARVLASGETKGSVTLPAPGGGELQVDLRVVPTESFGAALQYFTGSKEHNVRLRELAVKRKLRLNEYGLFDDDKAVAGNDEDGIYAKLGLCCPPPELRENRGEFDPEVAGRRLLELGDLRGDLHMHTVASDGACTIEEMATAIRDLGYKYMAISDHSRASAIANGLTADRLMEHLEAIREVNRRFTGVEILAGTEVDILPDGSLDYPDEVLAQCDFVTASIHSAMRRKGGRGGLSPTDRTLAAIENRWVTAIGHPTGRLINVRPPMELDIGRIVAAAAANDTALELNASYQRLDLKDVHLREAVEAGAKIVISSDAHSPEGLNQIRYGVLTARRAGLTAKDVINTCTFAALRTWIDRKRLGE